MPQRAGGWCEPVQVYLQTHPGILLLKIRIGPYLGNCVYLR